MINVIKEIDGISNRTTQKNKVNVFDDYVPIVRSKDGRITHTYLANTIEIPDNYNELCFMLGQAVKDDEFHVHINNLGGVIASANMIYYAMVNSKATIIGHLSGGVASAVTVITMACDKIIIAPYTQFMIHNYSTGTSGKGRELKDQMNFMNEEINKSFREYYRGFLSEEEIEDITNDHDNWMSHDEVLERWHNRQTHLKG